MKLGDIVEAACGTPQFRITECFEKQAPTYILYSQTDLLDDLVHNNLLHTDNKQVRTLDKVSTLKKGDVVFSLMSGTTAIVRQIHENYLYTQNYVKLEPDKMIDSKYLAYLLNEDPSTQKQLTLGLQGSQVLKYTLRQVKELAMPELPALEKQRCIGNIYFDQLRVQTLKKRVSEAETTIRLNLLREAVRNENDRKSI